MSNKKTDEKTESVTANNAKTVKVEAPADKKAPAAKKAPEAKKVDKPKAVEAGAPLSHLQQNNMSHQAIKNR